MAFDPRARPIYLAIIWHQHQPLYVDVQHDRLIAPWVRTHATKDYYDMAAIVKDYPNVHCTINLTTSLLKQLQDYYIARLGRCVGKSFDMKKFREDVEGRTDPWFDLLVKPAEEFTETDRDYLYRGAWSGLTISEVLLERFPEYERLKFRFRDNGDEATAQELRELKFWFFLAHFDPDFLNGPVRLPSGDVCELTDLVRRHDGRYYLCRPVTEADCQRLFVETYRVLTNIIPIHKDLMYRPEKQSGQIELVTTPYTHPILPLLYDSDIARVCQPNDPLPERFSFPQDADMQIKKALAYYKELFGYSAIGMWPAEGSVSHDIVPLFAKNGIRWIATDKQILDRSQPSGLSHLYPYRITTQWSDVVVLFRNTTLSDKVGFSYQTMKPPDAVDDFLHTVFSVAKQDHEHDKLLTVILDGENAWEWYRFDHDAKEFLHGLYRRLDRLYDSGEVVTVTPTEFLLGNSARGIPAHPPATLQTIDWLWPGSWIHANFDTWIGEEEENRAWNYLLQARNDLERAGVPVPHDNHVPPKGTREWYAYQAWESLYAAEGSDWFWWYGEDQSAPGGDKPFDMIYLTHLRNIYYYAQQYGASIGTPHFTEIIQERVEHNLRAHRGAMTRSLQEKVRVQFRCRVPEGLKPDAVYIVGNREELGEWVPNKVRMYDDGTHGDEVAGDGIWCISIDLPMNAEIHYKYTCGGIEGQWEPGDERVGRHRTIVVHDGERMVVEDEFGKFESP